MKTLVLATQKGGSGKSNLSRCLAVEAARGGARVALLDLDPQGTLTRWWRRREADDLQLVEGISTVDQIPAAQRHLADQGYDYLIIDTPGKRDEVTRLCLPLAALAVVPVHPSLDDLDAVGPTISEIKQAGVPFAFVLSRTGRTKLTHETLRVVAGYGRVSPVVVAQRVGYSEAAGHGLTGAEVDALAADEVAGVWGYLREQLNG